MRKQLMTCVTMSFLLLSLALPVQAEEASEAQPDGGADLAQELTNPVANLITVPIQMNYDQKMGIRDDGSKLQTNIQPVIPFDLTEDWNLITRTIMPLIYQNDIFPGAGSQYGLGDTSVSLFASPKKPTSNGIIWGAGPILLLPTATDSLLGGRKWGAGPSAIVLTMRGPWTLGALGNHVWSFAGQESRDDISSTFIQPFVAHTWPSAWTLSAQSETTYNWNTEKWSVPINLAVAKLVLFGKLPVSLQGGVGYWLESPETGSKGWRLRFQANMVLPKGW